MTIQLSPELEELVRQDVAAGGYESVDAFVSQAVAELHEREMWFLEHQEEIRTKVEEGWASAERGELLTSEEARSEVERQLRKRFDMPHVA